MHSVEPTGTDPNSTDPTSTDPTGTDGPSTEIHRVVVTDTAADLLRTLEAQHGPLMFHQSGGCCDGSAPMCYPKDMFLVGPADVHLDTLHVEGIEPIDVHISVAQYEYWKYTHLTIDAVPGRGAGFSVEGPTGFRFIVRSRMLDDAELEYFGLLSRTDVK